jgi:hypothetical protein
MSLVSGANATDVANSGHAAGVTGATKISVGVLLYPTTLTSLRIVVAKLLAGTRGWQLRYTGTAGDLDARYNRGTTNMVAITNNTPLSNLNAWNYVAMTIDTALGALQCHIYAGLLSGLAGGASAVEATYGTRTEGSGTNLVDTTADDLLWFNSSAANIPLQGRGSWGFFLNGTILTAAQLGAWFRRPNPRNAGGVALTATHGFGLQGAGTQTDETGNGNNAAVTGCSQNSGNPAVGVHGMPRGLDPYALVGGRLVHS